MIIDHLYLTVTLGLNWDIADAKVWWSRPDRAGKLMHVHWVSEYIHTFSDVLFSLGYIEMCAVYFYFNTDLKSVELQEYL